MKALVPILSALLLISCSLDDLIINPVKTDEYRFSTAWIPASQRELVTFESDGNTLFGAFIHSVRDNPLTILYCHGRERDMTGYWYEVELHYRAGYNVLTFDYRGFGRSEGEPTLQGLYNDGAAAVRFLIEERGIDPETIVYHGVSLGTGVASYLASDYLSPHSIILETPYASGDEWTEVLLPLNIPASFFVDGNYDNLQFVENFQAPLLVIHGGADPVLPFEHHGQVVYDAAPEPKQLLYLPYASHSDILVHTGSHGYINLIGEFLQAGQSSPPENP